MRASVLLAAASALLQASAEQLWLGQGVSARVAESLRLSFSNTDYVVHRRHCYNEEALSIGWSFASNWTAAAGATFAQALVQDADGCRRWVEDGRPSEHLSIDWHERFGDWNFSDANTFYAYFRQDERDWAVYRNLATVTAPVIPGMPCRPRPYLSQQIYFTGREGYGGINRFSQFHTTVGIGMRPFESLYVAAYWQCRNIEARPENWIQVRVAGFSATLLF